MQDQLEEKLLGMISGEDEKLPSSESRWSRFGNLCLLEFPDGTVCEFDFSCG